MPIFDFECPKCGLWEAIVLSREEEIAVCPKCGSEARKCISASNLRFVGAGFYSNDYKKKSKESSDG